MTQMSSTHRMYALAHGWLSDIQKGIQTTHAACDLVHQQPDNPWVKEWVEQGKTLILLNGASSKNLKEVHELLKAQEAIPYMDFREDEDSLEGARTAVVMVLPEYLYTFEFVAGEEERSTCKRLLNLLPQQHPESLMTIHEILLRVRQSSLA